MHDASYRRLTEKLWLSKNELTNTIPNSIGSLTNLGEHQLCTSTTYDESLLLTISTVHCISVLLDFGSNHINGSIPSAVGLMTNLKGTLAVLCTSSFAFMADWTHDFALARSSSCCEKTNLCLEATNSLERFQAQ